MNVFCLLCIPLLYFIRRTKAQAIQPEQGHCFWALPLGCVAAAIRYFIGPLITSPGIFGFSRWMSGFIDIIAVPALVPLLVCLLLVSLKVFPVTVDYTGFGLLWLTPLAVVQSLSAAAPPSPLPLMVVPLLWAAHAIGIPFFINRITNTRRVPIRFLLTICAIIQPFIAVTGWWMFFCQRPLWGGAGLAISIIPAVISLVTWRVESRELGAENGELGLGVESGELGAENRELGLEVESGES